MVSFFNQWWQVRKCTNSEIIFIRNLHICCNLFWLLVRMVGGLFVWLVASERERKKIEHDELTTNKIQQQRR